MLKIGDKVRLKKCVTINDLKALGITAEYEKVLQSEHTVHAFIGKDSVVLYPMGYNVPVDFVTITDAQQVEELKELLVTGLALIVLALFEDFDNITLDKRNREEGTKDAKS